MYELFSKKLLGAEKIAIFMHINPDADCIGSSLAMYKYLINLGKEAHVFLEPGNAIRNNLLAYPNVKIINANKPEKYDLGVCLDCATPGRMGDFNRDLFYNKCDEKLWIDHHIYTDKMPNSIIESDAAATAQILFKIFKEFDKNNIDKEVAFCLFGALAADSGCFSFSSTTSETMEIASQLIAIGIDNHDIIDKIYKEKSLSEFNLMTRVLSNIKFFYDNRMAVISFLANDFIETGCEIHNTEGIINNVMDIKGVILAVSIAEEKNNTFKISFRSKDPVDVYKYATMFGGGGHKNASGCKLYHSYGKCLEILTKPACEFMPC